MAERFSTALVAAESDAPVFRPPGRLRCLPRSFKRLPGLFSHHERRVSVPQQNFFAFAGFLQAGEITDTNAIIKTVTGIEGADVGVLVSASQFEFEPFGVAAVAEGADLEGELSRIVVNGRIASVRRHRFVGIGDGSECDEFDTGRPWTHKTDLSGSPVGQVDDPVADEWAAVVDTDSNISAVVKVAYVDNGIKRQGLVGCRYPVHVVGFAVGGLAAVKRVPIP